MSGSEAATFGLRYWDFFGHFGDSSKFLRNLYHPTRHFLYVLSLEDLGDTPRVCIEPKGVIRLRRGFGGQLGSDARRKRPPFTYHQQNGPIGFAGLNLICNHVVWADRRFVLV